MAGPNTHFKMTLRRRRQVLFKAGQNYIQVYQQTLGYKLGNEQKNIASAPPDGAITPPLSALGPYQSTLSDITNIPKL